MHHALKKAAKKRLAEVIEGIIKMSSKEEILSYVRAEFENLHSQFQNPDLIRDINDHQLDILSTPMIFGKDRGEIMASVINIENYFKGFKNTLKKNLKLIKKMDKKSLDSLFLIHIHDLALIAHDNREFRKKLKIKKGIFG